MRSRTAEGRLHAVLDYEGGPAEDDAPVAHLESPEGLALCGAAPGDEPGGLDCPSCAGLVLDVADQVAAEAVPNLEDVLGCELADGCVDPGGCTWTGQCAIRSEAR